MRKLGGLLLALVCAAALCAPWYPRVTAPHVGDAFEAAALLLETPDGVTFREEEIDADTVYRALEARYPYAFALHATTRPNRTTELRIELSRPARQEQAREYAAVLAAETVTDGMTDAERLRALHDALVRLCRYDMEAAEQPVRDGATAPFAADGALIDHKAVCSGYARAYAMLCEAAGLRTVYVSSERMNHGWNAVRLDGETYYIDCTFDDPVPDQGEYVSDRYFLRTADELAETHEWDRAFCEQALDSLEKEK